MKTKQEWQKSCTIFFFLFFFFFSRIVPLRSPGARRDWAIGLRPNSAAPVCFWRRCMQTAASRPIQGRGRRRRRRRRRPAGVFKTNVFRLISGVKQLFNEGGGGENIIPLLITNVCVCYLLCKHLLRDVVLLLHFGFDRGGRIKAAVISS